MAWAGALQERALPERALPERLVGSLNLLRLGWLSSEEVLGAPGILVIGTNYEIHYGPVRWVGPFVSGEKIRPARYGGPQVQGKRNAKASGSVTRYCSEILRTLPPNALTGAPINIGSAGTRVQANKKKSLAPTYRQQTPVMWLVLTFAPG